MGSKYVLFPFVSSAQSLAHVPNECTTDEVYHKTIHRMPAEMATLAEVATGVVANLALPKQTWSVTVTSSVQEAEVNPWIPCLSYLSFHFAAL